jgi:hypothetical protein
MTQNPYQPPSADVDVKQSSQRKPRPVLGVILGFILDIGFTVVAMFLVGAGIGIYVVSQGGGPDEITAFVNERAESFQWISSLIGYTGSFLGGLLCAYLAKEKLTKPVAAMIFLSISSGGIVTYYTGGDMRSFAASSLIATVVTMLGAGLYFRASSSQDN